MAKLALLIGVSEYPNGLNPLPAAVKDVEAIQRVLVNPEMGGFADGNITALKNPQPQNMREAIEDLFRDRHKDDLLLLFFSGHGIKDDSGKLYLSTSNTRKTSKGDLIRSSAIAASFVHESMSLSRSKRQVIILDSCFSGAFAEGLSAKDDGTIDIQQQLGGKGRAILTSSTSTQYSFEQEGSELSIYTRYLVEGINTGAADQDGDGWISIDELHEYAGSKVQEAAPAMTPKFYPVEEGHKILLAKSPKDDPRVIYRQEVERRAQGNQGNLSVIALRILEGERKKLNISQSDATVIQEEVLQPYREYKRKLHEYEQTLIEAVNKQHPFSPATQKDIKDYQQYLGLRDEDIAAIEKRVFSTLQPFSIIQTQPFEFETATLTVRSVTEKRPGIFGFFGGESTSNSCDINRSGGKAEFFQEDLGNGVILEMVKILGGNFLMGSPENEPESLSYEKPQHKVTIQPFFMGKFPVTQEQYQAVMGENPSSFQGKKRPVECVSWDNAVEFCAKVSKMSGKTYRLPRESEWEYACRAETNTPFCFGETITTDLANYNGNYTYGSAPEGQYCKQTTDVGSFPANAFGLYDMHGNVWEWCQDNWHENYKGAPNDNATWVSDRNNGRLLRGGSWGLIPGNCRCASRDRGERGNSGDYIGFRVVVVYPRTS